MSSFCGFWAGICVVILSGAWGAPPMSRIWSRKRCWPSTSSATRLTVRSLPFTPWAYAIARYKLLDHLRRSGVRAHVPLEDAGDLFARENPEEGAVRRDVDKLLSALPPRQRKLMDQVKISGFSMEEAAQASGMSVSAVKVSVHRAMKSLSAMVGNEDG